MPHENDAASRIALVTGGTDGIGKEIALGLARRGYQIVVVGRDAEKGAHAQNFLLANGAVSARFLQADLALVHETRALAEKVASSVPALHVLVHCAGVVLSGHQLTTEGLERNFATNYLARFVLTQALLPLMKYGGGEAARIILIGGAARGGRIFLEDVNLTRNFNLARLIRQVCNAHDALAVELSRRLTAARANVTVACLKVGVVKTNIRKEFPLWLKWLAPLLFDPLLAQPAPVVADSALRLIDESDGADVLYSHILRFKRLRPEAGLIVPRLGARLWVLSEQLAADAAR
jgi:NAD(P)-dependent dehydrogenase (short-subunit alcohol dehydrogenase family)